MSSLPGPAGGVPITAESQPALHQLVHDCAARLGVPAPPRIWLGPDAVVESGVDRHGAGLVIGLPVAFALSRAELTALLEHELGVLSALSGELASEQYRRWAQAIDIVVADADQPPADRTVQRLGPEAEPVERAADQACADAAVAARAVIRLERLTQDFLIFCTDVEQALSAFGGLRYRVSDLHDGWRRRLAAGIATDDEDIDRDEAEMTGGRHPGLAAAARTLVGEPLELSLPPDPVAIAPLTGPQERQLASSFLPERRYVRWRTFATVPPRMWRRAAARQVRPVLNLVTRALGRKPDGYAEAADVIRTRPADVMGVPVEQINIPLFDRDGWLVLLEDRLLGRGWTRIDPAVPGLLRRPDSSNPDSSNPDSNPDGRRLNGLDLIRRAVADPIAYGELRRLLSE
jgi:hypothetical protein